MKRTVMMLATAAACCAASASWYWPFGSDAEADAKEKSRLHNLMKPANDFVEEAEEAALAGDADKAIELYGKALAEFARVEAENPERAATTEFTPLRQKAASCQAALDAVRFEQINRNARAVAVSDTADLQRRFDEKHGIRSAAAEPVAKPAVPAAKPAERVAKPVVSASAPAKAEKKPAPQTFKAKLLLARDEIRAGDFAAADVLLEALVRERPTDLNALLLRAAAQSGTGHRLAARHTLERANRAHPKSYLPYYNLASLALEIDADAEAARSYYDLGRSVGGPADAALEKRLEEVKE